MEKKPVPKKGVRMVSPKQRTSKAKPVVPTKAVLAHSKADLAEFERILEMKLDERRKECERLSGEIVLMSENKDGKSNLGEDTGEFSDLATLNQELERASKFTQHILRAKERLRTGKYGICYGCSEPHLIDPDRLRAQPVATMCIKAKEQQSVPAYAKKHQTEYSFMR